MFLLLITYYNWYNKFMNKEKLKLLQIIIIIFMVTTSIILVINFGIIPLIKSFVEIKEKFIEQKDTEEINWSDIILSSQLPYMPSYKGEVILNEENILLIYIENIDENKYNDYINKCYDKGYNINSERTKTFFHSFSKDNYELLIKLKKSKMIIKLDTFKKEETINDSMRPEIKEIFDEFEIITENYFKIIKKANEEVEDKEILNDYKELGKNILKLINKIDKLENKDDINEEEIKYYIKIKLKSFQKLLELV